MEIREALSIKMLEKLKILEERFNELSKMLIQPDIISDQSKYIKI